MAEKEQRLHSKIKRHFPPEFIGRLDGIIPFTPLSTADITAIVRCQLDLLCNRLAQQDIILEYDENIIDFVTEKCAGNEYGARNIKNVISRYIETVLGDMIIAGTLCPGEKAGLTAEDGVPAVKIFSSII